RFQQPTAPDARPATVVLPRVAIGIARGRSTTQHPPSPWLDALQPGTAATPSPRLRLVAPSPPKRSPMSFLAPALAFVTVCAIALGIGPTIRGLRQSDTVVVTPTTVPAQPTAAPTAQPSVSPTSAPTVAPTTAPTTAPAPAPKQPP